MLELIDEQLEDLILLGEETVGDARVAGPVEYQIATQDPLADRAVRQQIGLEAEVRAQPSERRSRGEQFQVGGRRKRGTRPD